MIKDSPEQAMGQVVGPPTDVFSLGAVLTFAATGNGPFGDGPTPTLMFRVVHQPPDLSRAPEELRPLLESCQAKEPEDRPTARQLLEMTDGAELAEGEWLPEPLTATLAKYAPTAVSPRTRSARIPAAAPAGMVPPGSGTGPIETAAAPGAPPKRRRRRWRREEGQGQAEAECRRPAEGQRRRPAEGQGRRQPEDTRHGRLRARVGVRHPAERAARLAAGQGRGR